VLEADDVGDSVQVDQEIENGEHFIEGEGEDGEKIYVQGSPQRHRQPRTFIS